MRSRLSGCVDQKIQFLNLGSARFAQATQPATRVDGSTLQFGDIWYDTTNLINWFWNVSIWMSENQFQVGPAYDDTSANINSSRSFFFSPFLFDSTNFDIFATEALGSTLVQTTNNGSNYWTLTFGWRDASNSTTSLYSWNTSANSAGSWVGFSQYVNAQISISTARTFSIDLAKVGTPGAISLSFSCRTHFYR